MKYDPLLLIAQQLINTGTNLSSSWVGSAGTKPDAPVLDEFYDFDSDNITQYPLGDILNVREVGLTNYSYSKAWQILYRSENTFGKPIASVTTLVLPANLTGSGTDANVVSYQLAEDAAFLNCNPSYTLLTGPSKPELQGILDSGYVLNYPDHEGRNSSFSAGPLEGKLTLDSLRAIKNAEEFSNVKVGKTILWGYSGGSIATGWASQFQGWYAPELDIVAAAVGGFVVNLTATVDLVNGTPLVGFAPPGILGLAAEYPGLSELLTDQIKPENATRALEARAMCALEDVEEFQSVNVFDFFKDGAAILQEPSMAETLANTTLGSSTPEMPLIVYQGIEDQIAPIANVDQTVSEYCSNGGKVRYIRASGLDHFGTAEAYDLQVLESFAGIFAGMTWDNCTVYGLPIGEYGNNTVPQPLPLSSISSANSSGDTGAGSSTVTTAQNELPSTPVSGSPNSSATTSIGTSSISVSGTSTVANAADSRQVTGLIGILALALAVV